MFFCMRGRVGWRVSHLRCSNRGCNQFGLLGVMGKWKPDMEKLYST